MLDLVGVWMDAQIYVNVGCMMDVGGGWMLVVDQMDDKQKQPVTTQNKTKTLPTK